jgi:hypothetical protein
LTEQEVSDDIDKWRRYSVLGSPDEPDYGPDTPRAYGLSSAEKTFDDPNRDLWRPLQDRINEAERRKDTKEAYDTVEPVYKSLDFGTRMQVKAFYFERNDWSGPPSHRMREAVNIFRGKVAHEGS